jgi:tetratricopeptide (TPR) repeat protein
MLELMILRGISTFALGVMLTGPAQAGTNDEPVSLAGNYLASRTASHVRDLDATTTFTSAALKLDQNNGVLLERLFQAEVMLGDVTKAEPLAAQVIKLNSQQRMARLVLGLKEFRARRYAESRVHFDEAAYTPLGTLTSGLLDAWSYAGEGSLNAALKALDKLDGQDAFTNYKALHAALIADYLGSGVRAEASYKKAYQLAPTSLRIVQAYGNFLERSGRKDDAAKVYGDYLADGQRDVLVQQALAKLQSGQKPAAFISTPQAGASEVLFSIASALTGDQNAESALTYSQLALRVAGDKPVILTTLGGIQADLRFYEQSSASFDQVPKDSPLRAYADTQIAINLHRMDKKDEAIARLLEVTAKNPKDFDATVTLAAIYRASDQFDKSVETYTKAIGLMGDSDKNNWRIYYDRGIALDKLKQFDKSEEDFRKAMEISKGDSSVLNYLGYSMIDRGEKLDEALAMVKKAVELKPNDGYIVDSLGWAYFKLRDYEQAVTYCERAVDLNPGDPIIAEHLGDVYWMAGRKLEAQFQWQHAKDNHPESGDLARLESKLKDGLPEGSADKPADNSSSGRPAQPADDKTGKPING